MKKSSTIIILLILGVTVVSIIVAKRVEKNSEKEIAEIKSQGTVVTPAALSPTIIESQKMEIDQTKKYTAVLNTSIGKITIELNTDKTPITVNNFVSLSKKNFYNNTIFHRVINGFMIQGGDPKGDGTGGPGYQFDDEPFEGEYTRGVVAMANAGPNTNGSQFFIVHKDNPLPKNYVIFGRVTDGIEVVDKIATASVQASPMGEMSKPVDPVKIQSIQILEE